MPHGAQLFSPIRTLASPLAETLPLHPLTCRALPRALLLPFDPAFSLAQLDLKVNKLTSANSALSYNYYDLKFCEVGTSLSCDLAVA